MGMTEGWTCACGAAGLDYFGARYFSSAQGRFTSPDKPFADQHPADPQSWNLYSYARNNPLKFVDDGGEAVIYADRRLEIISEARRQESSSYNTWLQGFEGEGRPDLTIQYGSSPRDPDGSITDGNFHGNIALEIYGDGGVVVKPTIRKSGVITVDKSVEGDPDQTSNVLAHEVSHANDARTNPNRYANEPIKDAKGNVIKHDDRPVEQRAIGGARLSNDERKAFQKQHKEQYKQIEKQKEEQLKRERQRRKEEGN